MSHWQPTWPLTLAMLLAPLTWGCQNRSPVALDQPEESTGAITLGSVPADVAGQTLTYELYCAKDQAQATVDPSRLVGKHQAAHGPVSFDAKNVPVPGFCLLRATGAPSQGLRFTGEAGVYLRSDVAPIPPSKVLSVVLIKQYAEQPEAKTNFPAKATVKLPPAVTGEQAARALVHLSCGATVGSFAAVLEPPASAADGTILGQTYTLPLAALKEPADCRIEVAVAGQQFTSAVFKVQAPASAQTLELGEKASTAASLPTSTVSLNGKPAEADGTVKVEGAIGSCPGGSAFSLAAMACQ